MFWSALRTTLGRCAVGVLASVGSVRAAADEPSPGAPRHRLSALTKRREAATTDALRWLAAHQTSEGGWSAAGFGAWCRGERKAGASSEGAGAASHDLVVSALALSALLGAGYTDDGGDELAPTVRRALAWLKRSQRADGRFGDGEGRLGLAMHGVATLAAVEAFGMIGSATLKDSAAKALGFLRASREGWLSDQRDAEVPAALVGWGALALVAAELLSRDDEGRGRPRSFPADRETLEKAQAWIRRRADVEQGDAVAMATLFRVLGGEEVGKDSVLRGVLDTLCAPLPQWGAQGEGVSLLRWVFTSFALGHASEPAWPAWSEAVSRALLQGQRKDGDACSFLGSWDPVGPWGAEGGRVASTALGVLCLSAQIRYDRVEAPK